MLIFHIATDADWQAARASGSYTTSTLGVTLEQEGFLHCSRDSQAARVLAKYYADVSEPLMLLTVDTNLLTSPWQLDPVPGAELSFPHIYGPLNPSAVVDTTPLTKNAAGEWELPELPVLPTSE
ncbi:MAG: DUF952 domain-containing protein [Actinomycetota bacterium]|nr:DUF952 domain-containing protein [Actinomycetota bacterium]